MKRLEKIAMRKFLFFFLLAITAMSCSSDSSEDSHEYLVPVIDATVPQTMSLGQQQTIYIKYSRPTDCDIFNGFYTQDNGFDQIIGVRCLKFNEGNCTDDLTVYEVPLTFTPNEAGTYHFKFWTGEYAEGDPTYIEFESVVE